MGGVVSKVGQVVGIASKKSNEAVQEATGNKSVDTPGRTTATSEQEQEAARARLRRRGGRQLLSDARLNPEGGVQTLGGGSNLG
jgi:microcystin degradation protein MlrC